MVMMPFFEESWV